ncbi:NAD-dependent DNA ligase LigA [Candidatus Chlamydia sanziniae]|uniref:DNA ligase n=1 Tax=Candidatus Chlamydia sanziniae TaxID=1806891 RepID=A0A1A9HXW7_9CHLA|nr:NAD-dependent DNA ligase LigA [Candidatus Chlamydia sanziniae]ANH78933.1 DNA ligase [Candidatus Chlamydia sanziniae]
MRGKGSKEYYLMLCQELADHDYSYYVLHDPKISDYVYDMKMRELLQIEVHHPDWKVLWSPSIRLGDRPSGGFAVVDHQPPMLSIANSYSREELEEFFSRVKKTLSYTPTYVVELKIDGIAVAIRYEDRVLVQALSRGNGRQGEDITANIRTIRSLPLKLPRDAPEFVEVRGEVFFLCSTFEKINVKQQQLGRPMFANPRNAAGGTLKQLSPQEVAKRKLEISIYTVITTGMNDSHYENLLHCRTWGFPVCGHPQYCKTTDDVISILQTIEIERYTLPMEIDGAVIKVDSLMNQQRLGMTGKHYRWALAYKYAPEQVETIIEDIIVQVGRTGVLTPVAKLRPVVLSGSLVSRASLYNEEEIHRKDIRIGDTVYVEKGGEVIPKIVGVCKDKRVQNSQLWQMPEFCPGCHGKLVREPDKVGVRCSNPSCSAGVIEKIRFFVGRSALDIQHLGMKIITKLVDLGMLHTFSDIFQLTKEDLLQVPGFRERSVENLLAGIEKAKHVSLDRFLVALGISYVGISAASALASCFHTIEKIISAPYEALLTVEGIGEKVAHSIIDYFASIQHIQEIEKMLALGVKISPYQEVNSMCVGKVFVMTGFLLGMSRSQAEAAIRNSGGKVSSSVSKQTDYLIVGTNPGSKLKRARELRVPILTEEAFVKLLKLG